MDDLQRTWELWARRDPLWAVLSTEQTRGRGWDLDAFLATGREHVEWMLEWLDALGITARSARWLDFGCGVGRLSTALAEHADRVDGVDVSPTMVEEARALAAGNSRLRFHVNAQPDLRLFDDGTFDLVASFLVLQHIPSAMSKHYVAEMVRVLAPGGVAVFGAPERYVGESVERFALPASAYRAGLRIRKAPMRLRTGATSTVEVDVRNTSSQTWPAASPHELGLGRLAVGNHWTTVRGRVLVNDDGRVHLPHDVAPGATVRVELDVRAPAHPGIAILVCDIVQEGVCWFAQHHSRVARRPVVVLRASAAREQSDAGEGPWGGGEPPVFGMYPLTEEEVRAAVTEAGGRVVAVMEEPGDGWRSLRYAVIRD